MNIVKGQKLKAKTENNGQNENSWSDSGRKENAVDHNENNFNGSNQRQSYAVHAQPAPMKLTEMPMIPLPTQDFRI